MREVMGAPSPPTELLACRPCDRRHPTEAHPAPGGADREKVPTVNRTWDALFDTLLGEQAELAERVRGAIQAVLPAYRDLPRQELDGEVEFEVARVLQSARTGCTAVSEDEVAELAAIGEARAQQGVPVDEMLRAWRIGVEVVIGYAREIGQRLGIADGHVLEFVQSTLAWSDVAMVATAQAHRRAELTLAFTEEQRRVAFVRGTLLGTMSAPELGVQAEAYGLDPAREYVAVRAQLHEGVSQHKVERVLGFHDGVPHRRGLSALVDGCLAGFTTDPPPRNVEAVAGFGPPRPLDRLAESDRLAARALMTAQAYGLKGAHDIPSFGLRAAVATDADVGEPLQRRYLKPLAECGSPRELMATLRAYLACGMHVERTATRLFVHQNTVRYRLARFEELTGTSLRETDVLFEVWWALELSTMRL